MARHTSIKRNTALSENNRIVYSQVCCLYGKYFICNVIGTYVGDIGDTCTQCNAVNGTHVGDVGDTCM